MIVHIVYYAAQYQLKANYRLLILYTDLVVLSEMIKAK